MKKLQFIAAFTASIMTGAIVQAATMPQGDTVNGWGFDMVPEANGTLTAQWDDGTFFTLFDFDGDLGVSVGDSNPDVDPYYNPVNGKGPKAWVTHFATGCTFDIGLMGHRDDIVSNFRVRDNGHGTGCDNDPSVKIKWDRELDQVRVMLGAPEVHVAPVPLPTAGLMLLLGLGGMIGLRKR